MLSSADNDWSTVALVDDGVCIVSAAVTAAEDDEEDDDDDEFGDDDVELLFDDVELKVSRTFVVDGVVLAENPLLWPSFESRSVDRRRSINLS